MAQQWLKKKKIRTEIITRIETLNNKSKTFHLTKTKKFNLTNQNSLYQEPEPEPEPAQPQSLLSKNEIKKTTTNKCRNINPVDIIPKKITLITENVTINENASKP